MEQTLTPDILYLFKEVKDLFKQENESFKEIKELYKETDRKFRETDKQIGKLGNRLGEFIEEMVRPGAVRLFRERGINVHVVSRNVTAERDGEAAEIDLLVVNDGEMIVVECKSSLSIDDVNEHLERLGEVKRLFPHYRDMKVMGAVAEEKGDR